MDKFLYGAGYYPLLEKREDWDKHLKTMKECNINIVRTAELFATWEQIEPIKGTFKFQWLDDFFELCKDYDIKILLGTGTASPPYWLHEEDPDMNILSITGRRFPNNATYSWACYNNPTYRNASKNYIEKLINRYKNHESLFAYQIHNEIGFPFMPLSEGAVEAYCYCDHCIEKFRLWVKNKYKTLDALNKAYTWCTTNMFHTSWEQINPPYVKPTAWASVTRWLDYRLFQMETIVDFVKWQNEIIKKYDTQHKTTTNIFFMKSQDPMAAIIAIDQFEIAKVVDVIGYDLYPGSGNKLEKKPEFSSMFLDMAKSTAKPYKKDYWLLETESGPIGGWALGPDRNVRGFDIIRNVSEAISHDAKFVLYQGFKDWEFMPLHWGGLVELDGAENERTDGAKFIGEFLKNQSDFLNKSSTNQGEIAILLSKENAIIANSMGHEAFLINCLRGAYRVYWEKGYTIDFITPEILEMEYSNKYAIIHMPFMLYITEDIAKFIEKYVANGGTILSSARAGYVGQNAWYNMRVPPFDLSNVFGIKVTEVYANIKSKITFEGKNYDGYWHKEHLEKTDNVKILGWFFDDKIAITLNNYKSGKAIYIATHADGGYIEKESLLLHDILSYIERENNIRPRIKVTFSNRKNKEIDVHSLLLENKELLIITNYVHTDRMEDFWLEGKKNLIIDILDKSITKITDYSTNEDIYFDKDEDSTVFQCTIQKNKVKFLFIEKGDCFGV